MSLTRAQARDQILALLKAKTDTISGLVVLWDDAQKDPPSDNVSTQWARVDVRHVDSRAAFVGHRRYTKTGLLTISLYSPLNQGLSNSDDWCRTIESAFQGVSTANGVWFRNTRSSEAGRDRVWFRTDIVTEFSYDETFP
jgi:hypothetical protein